MIRAGAVHAAAMASIHRAAFPAAEAWERDAFACQLAQPHTFGLIDERGGMILARAVAGEAELLTLAVEPASRRQGIGTALLACAMAEAAARGARTLFLEVSAANTGACALYDTLGFVRIGRRPAYYSDGSDALVLGLQLEPAVLEISRGLGE